MFCCSVFISKFLKYLWFDTKCDAKKWKFLVFQNKKATYLYPSWIKFWKQPHHWKFESGSVCTCFGKSVTLSSSWKQKPNVCSALREVNCMLDIWSRVQDQRQACDMKCKSVFNFYFFLFVFIFTCWGFFFFLRSVSDLSTITKPSL